jgi:hypothetical protein
MGIAEPTIGTKKNSGDSPGVTTKKLRFQVLWTRIILTQRINL